MPAEFRQGGEMLAAPPKPCLTGSMADDRVAYEYGTSFRPSAIGLFIVGVALITLIVVLGRRWRPTLRRTVTTVGALLLLVSLAMGWMVQRLQPLVPESAHEHADIAIRVRGQLLDLSAERFQSEAGHVLSDYAHLHDGIGTIVHKHARGVSYGYFLWTIRLPLAHGCMTQPSGLPLCDTDREYWTAIVNGQVEPNLRDREIRDLDRVLLSYGSETPTQLLSVYEETVKDDACLYSETCPERGPAPQESCGS